MIVEGSRTLILGGHGLVGRAVCRELITRNPKTIYVHSLRDAESRQTIAELHEEFPNAPLEPLSGDILGKMDESPLGGLGANILPLNDDDLQGFVLYSMIARVKPEIVIDCVNTATAIAYRNVFKNAEALFHELEGDAITRETTQQLLDSLYIPRLIRHIQVLYRGMTDAGTKFYGKVGTTGTGGMGLNIPYTHSEEKPSRVLLSKSAMAGAHSMMLFLMARTPGAPITKEFKPAAAIAWKEIGYGPIKRKGQPINLVSGRPHPLGTRFTSHDPDAAEERDEVMNNVFIDTGENGIFSLEEFSALTTSEQMEFVTPEEIAHHLVFELEGGNTGFDVISALDTTIIGPSYRAGLMRHWALERMVELEADHNVFSVAYEMLGPPRLSKLLFEAHLLRLAFKTMNAVRSASVERVTQELNDLVTQNPEVANQIISVGVPILLANGNVIRGTRTIVPAEAVDEPITDAKLDKWVHDGWVDLRDLNCKRWINRFEAIHREIEMLRPSDTSSRYLRTPRFWHDENHILPGKIAGWIFAIEDRGARMK